MTFPQIFFIATLGATLVSCHALDTQYPVSTAETTTTSTGTQASKTSGIETATAQQDAQKTLVGLSSDDGTPLPGSLIPLMTGTYKPDKNNPHLDDKQIEELELQKEVFTFKPTATSMFTPDEAGCKKLFEAYRFQEERLASLLPIKTVQ